MVQSDERSISKAGAPLAGIAAIAGVLLVGLAISARMLNRYLNLPGLAGLAVVAGMGLTAAGVGAVLAWRLPLKRLVQLLGLAAVISVGLAAAAPQPETPTSVALSWNRQLWSVMVLPGILSFAAWCGVSLTWLLLRDEVVDLVEPVLEMMPALRVPRTRHGQATHPGRRAYNEDSVAAMTFAGTEHGAPLGLYLVADGVGGRNAGEVASTMVTEAVSRWIVEENVVPRVRGVTRRLMAEKRPEEKLAAAIEQANAEILQYAQRTNSELGTTVTAALVIGEAAAVANVGDSRTYHLRDGRLRQVTEDHSFVARLVAEGLSTPAEARANPRRHEIYRCVGDKPELLVDTFVVDLHVGDRLILCSDGLWEIVPDEEIQRIVEAAPTPQVATDELITAAVRAGGDDNISVIVVEVE